MNQTIEWKTLEHHHEEKHSDWFWAVGIIAVSLAATAIILNNFLFAVLILIAAFTLAMHAARPPRTFDAKIDKHGVTVHEYHYPFSSLDAFWINEHETPPVLYLKSQRFFLSLIIISLEAINPEDVKRILRKSLPEQELHEPLLQKLAEYLGF